MTLVGDRLRAAMAVKSWDQADLADAVGCTQGAVSQILLGNTQRSRFLPDMADKLGVSLKWLRGESDDKDPSADMLPAPAALAEQLGLQMIPEVDIAYSMGGGAVIGDVVESTMVPFRRDWLQRLTRGGPADVFLTRGKGDSMMPTILDGDDVLVNRADRTVKDQDMIWALGYGELGQIKRVRRLTGGRYELHSDNPTVRPIPATEDELFIVGRVIWIGRRM